MTKYIMLYLSFKVGFKTIDINVYKRIRKEKIP